MNEINIEKVIALAPAVIAFISIFVEISPIKLNPISLMLGWMATILNKKIYIKLDEIEKATRYNRSSIDKLRKDMDVEFLKISEEAANKEAERLRSKIIEFADSCRVGTKHTQNHFENIFREITSYYDYCSRHKISNHFIDEEHTFIREVYQKCIRENSFL